MKPFLYRRGFNAQGIEPLRDAVERAHQAVIGKPSEAPGTPECSMWRDINPYNELGIPSLTYACLTLTAACDRTAVTTIEGIGHEEALHPMQAAFIEYDAAQCGFCTPGQILAAIALLARIPNPTEADVIAGMSGNLCRCGTYPKIVRAVLAAARRAAPRAILAVTPEHADGAK